MEYKTTQEILFFEIISHKNLKFDNCRQKLLQCININIGDAKKLKKNFYSNVFNDFKNHRKIFIFFHNFLNQNFHIHNIGLSNVRE